MKYDATRIRLADPERDAERVAQIYRPAVDGSHISFEESAPDAAEMAGRMRAVLDGLPWLVAEAGDGSGAGENNRVIGYAYAGRHRERAAYRWSADISVYVDPESHGRGVGRALYDELAVRPAPAGLRQRLRRRDLAQPCQRRAARSHRDAPHRRLRARGLQARRVARRRLVRDAHERASGPATGAGQPGRR